MTDQGILTNEKIRSHKFLDDMYRDPYFPKPLVDKCKNVLLDLCYNIEKEKPGSLKELYALTHASTESINNLQDEFLENDSEIETMARECIAADFEYISAAYGFKADPEELIAPREW